jgi:hypothetical protein
LSTAHPSRFTERAPKLSGFGVRFASGLVEELMRLRSTTNKQREVPARRQTTSGSDALAIREVYPAEEFAGFENFGEFPEWQPGQAESSEEPKHPVPVAGDQKL